MASSAVWIPPEGRRTVTTMEFDVTPCEVAPPLLPENETQAGEYGSPETCRPVHDETTPGALEALVVGAPAPPAPVVVVAPGTVVVVAPLAGTPVGVPTLVDPAPPPVLAPTFCSGAMDGT